MRRTKREKGITLIALIITIVVLIILAFVSVGNITNWGIIDKTKNAKTEYEIAQEKKKLEREVLEWQLISKNQNPTLKEYLSDIYGEQNVKENDDGSLTVTVPSGNEYTVKIEDDSIFVDEIIELVLDKNIITKEIITGSSATETLTATLTGTDGELTWESSDTNIAEISGSGNTRTIIMKKAGSAIITVSWGNTVSATCDVIVTENGVTLTVSPTTIKESIIIGNTITKTLTATLTGTTGDLTWTSSNATVASVVGNGTTATVKLKAVGTATITVSYGNIASATCNITVTQKEAITITLSPETITGSKRIY